MLAALDVENFALVRHRAHAPHVLAVEEAGALAVRMVTGLHCLQNRAAQVTFVHKRLPAS